ncbi:MAG: hypothetical protein ABI301_04725 [Jatrophihabitantaceae bacterium]
MDSVAALDSSEITKVGIGATIVVVVVGLLLSLIISAVIARVVILVVVVLLGVFIWQQRAVIENHVKKCELTMSYFGVHVDAPQSVQARCKAG